MSFSHCPVTGFWPISQSAMLKPPLAEPVAHRRAVNDGEGGAHAQRGAEAAQRGRVLLVLAAHRNGPVGLGERGYRRCGHQNADRNERCPVQLAEVHRSLLAATGVAGLENCCGA